jgi:hypothetical protein
MKWPIFFVNKIKLEMLSFLIVNDSLFFYINIGLDKL